MRCARPRRACLQLIDTSRSSPPFLQSAPPSTAHPPHCVRQASTSTLVCGGGGWAAVLAFLYLWPPSPLATIHGLFASPGTQQCRKNGIIASLICSRPIPAPLAIPGSARRRQCLAAQNSGAQNSGVSGSSWVSGLLVGVRWRVGAWSRGEAARCCVCVCTCRPNCKHARRRC